jgi:4'-phosphopantetheinyl transferase
VESLLQGREKQAEGSRMPVSLSADGPTVPRAVLRGAVELVVAALDLGGKAVQALAALLSEPERQRANRFVFARDRRRFTVARARLRLLLAERLGVEAAAIELIYGPQGKPALARRFAQPDLRFNLSHSEDVALYAFAHARDIGIDVETVRELPDAQDIAARFFSRRENEAYLTLNASDRPLGFFNCWTRKEAFVKAIGDGLQYPLGSFDVSLAPGEPARILRVGGLDSRECGWTLRSFSPAPGLIGAVVYQSSESANA